MATERNRDPAAGELEEGRLGSWKEIAAYLDCGVRTVQRWERLEGLPVHRHVHNKMGSVYAYRRDLDAWRQARRSEPAEPAAETETGSVPTAQPTADALPANAHPSARVPTAPVMAGAAPKFPEPGSSAPSRRKSRAPIAVAAGAALLAAAFLVSRMARPQPKAEAGRVMLAVLPFVNLSGDPSQDYFSDGLTEEMITELGRADPERLGVIARTSAMKYKNASEDVAQIGRELDCGYVLEGSVRREQQEVRISAQLIQVSDQTHIWAQSYQLQARDVLAVQREVAQAISDRIRQRLALPRSTASVAERAVDPEAYEDYLKGRYFLNLRSQPGLTTAVEYFLRSTAKDASYAPAYAGLADCYTLLALYGSVPREVMPQAKEAAQKSVALDDSLAEAHTSLAAVEAIYDWNWPEAERQFRRALDLNPSYAPAHHWYAQLYLIPQGRYDEAIAEMKLARALDPVSLIINTDLGWTYFVARRYDEALDQYKKTLEMSSDFVPLHFRLTQYFEQRHMYDQAVEQAEEADRVDGRPETAAEIKSVYLAGGYRGLQQEQLREVAGDTSHPPRFYTGSLAAAYGDLGKKEQAFGALQKAVEDRAPDLIYLRADPIYDSLRADPRFLATEQRIGLVH